MGDKAHKADQCIEHILESRLKERVQGVRSPLPGSLQSSQFVGPIFSFDNGEEEQLLEPKNYSLTFLYL